MSTQEFTALVRELQELRAMQDDLAAEIEGITDRIKNHMDDSAMESIEAGTFKVTYTPVTSTRLDTAALRRDLPEVWQEYGKTTTVRRFSVALRKPHHSA